MSITVSYVLWGAPLPVGTTAHLVPLASPGTPLAWVPVRGVPPAFSVTPEAVVVHLPQPPTPVELASSGGALGIVADAIAQLAAAQCLSVRDMWMALKRLYADRTFVDVGAAVGANQDYRRVLQTEIGGSVAGAGGQCVAMTLRARDAKNDSNGAVVTREVHHDHAQILIALGGTARATVELLELGRRVPLIPPGQLGASAATMAIRVPPGITHTVYLETPADTPDAALHMLSVYTSAEHPWDRVQAERPMDKEEDKGKVAL